MGRFAVKTTRDTDDGHKDDLMIIIGHADHRWKPRARLRGFVFRHGSREVSFIEANATSFKVYSTDNLLE